jgi:hypothetical protein
MSAWKAGAGPLPPGCELGHHRRQVPPCAVPGDRDPGGIRGERLGPLGGEQVGGEGVLDRGGERVLGRLPVLGREDDDARLAGQETAGLIVGVEAGQHPAPAVVVDDQGKGPGGARGTVEARRQGGDRAPERPSLAPLRSP